jgi:hypothetical protein
MESSLPQPSFQQQPHPSACERRRKKVFSRTTIVVSSLLVALVCCEFPRQAQAWGSGGSVDTSIYGDAQNREWLTDGSTISLKLEGCVWGVTENNEDMGCMEESSNDGTEYWYQMANCRRAQVVYNLYTGSGCGSFKESVSDPGLFIAADSHLFTSQRLVSIGMSNLRSL